VASKAQREDDLRKETHDFPPELATVQIYLNALPKFGGNKVKIDSNFEIYKLHYKKIKEKKMLFQKGENNVTQNKNIISTTTTTTN